MPRFSIVMPTFRREHILYHIVENVRLQTFKNWELILVDNWGSNYKFTDPRIKCHVYTEQHSASAARNFGVKQITGDLVCFFDDDDYMYPHYLQTFNDAFSDPKIKMAHCAMLNGPGKDIHFSFATPLVCTVREFITPTWIPSNVHDQIYFQGVEKAVVAKYGRSSVIQLNHVLCIARTESVGGLRQGRH